MHPVWKPRDCEKTNLYHFIQMVRPELTSSVALTEQSYAADYQVLHHWSITQPEAFWENICKYFSVDFTVAPRHILKNAASMLSAVWFEGAEFNFAQQLLKRRDQHPALISYTETQAKAVISYETLYERVAACQGGLMHAGIQAGDRVAAVMPNIPETIIAMLASTALGAIWSSCSPDFGVEAILDRFSQIQPKMLIITNAYQYNGKQYSCADKISRLAQSLDSLECIVVYSFIDIIDNTPLPPHATTWDQFITDHHNLIFKSLPFAHPLYILFSSGTTGQPKCIVHGAGGTLLQHLKELGLHTNIMPHDNLLFYTTCGWMMWNWMVSVLALGATLTLYEGAPAYPHAAHLFEIIEHEQVSIFGTSAKFISFLEKENINLSGDYLIPSLKTILSTGSPLLPKHYDFVYDHIKVDVQLSSISGGTDIVSCFALGNPLLPVYKGELQCLGLGMNVQVLNEQGKPIQEACGELVCTQPFPSMPIFFWNDPDKTDYNKAYFQRFLGVWAHGDFAQITTHKGLIIYGRSDATLNPGGIRIGTAEIYRQIETIREIGESVVVSQDWQDDVRIILFVTLKAGIILDKDLQERIRAVIKIQASPKHVPAKIIQVPDIPRTMNGKIVELAVRQIIHNQPILNKQVLANPEVLAYFQNLPELQF